MQEKCKNCDGSGLAGQGEQPWLHHGRVTTCPECSGTGKKPEAPSAEVQAPLSTEENAEPAKRGGILGILGF